MNADWEAQQEALVRNAELLPELDSGLKRRVLLEAARSKKKSDFIRRAVIAASLFLVVGVSTFSVSRLLTPADSSPVAGSGDSVEGTDDGFINRAMDEQKERAKIFPSTMGF